MRPTFRAVFFAALTALMAAPATGAWGGSLDSIGHEAAAAGSPTLGRQSSPAISPRRVDIRLEVRPELPAALVEADLSFVADEARESVVVFLRADMELDVVRDAEGLPLTYTRRGERVRVSTPALEPGALSVWSFRYRVPLADPLSESGQILLTVPWYPHLRRAVGAGEYRRYVPMAMSVTTTLPRPWTLVSAGTGTTSTNDGLVTHTWRDATPSENIPLVIAQLVAREKRDAVGNVGGFFAAQQRSLAGSYVDYVARTAAFFTDRIGTLTRRTWNIAAVDLPETISGLSLPGLTILDGPTIRDGMQFPYRVLAHEIAHQWWNFHIEIPRARDGWLREGLPTYSALLFLENEYGAQMMRQELDRSRRVALSVTSDEPLELGFEMSSPDAIYALNYHKAAVVLHMLRGVIGLDHFLALMRALHDFDGDVTTDVFVDIAERLHDADLSWFFDAWLRRAEVPSFEVRYTVAAAPEGKPWYELTGTIEQRGARVRAPVLIRVALEAAPPLETTVWIEPGTTEFNINLPSPPRSLEFDPRGELLYRQATVERSIPEAREEEAAESGARPPERNQQPAE